MQPTTINARALAKSGMEALQKGDAQGARAAFEQIINADQADASICLALAYACRVLKDRNAMIAAVDKTLALEQGNLRALIMKADYLHKLGDARGAAAYYVAVVKAAAAFETLPPDVRDDVVQAQAMADRYALQFDSFLRTQLLEHGLHDGPSAQRFKQSLDILAGGKQRYIQEPRIYFFPELAQIQFFDRSDFPWLTPVEAETAAIRAELIEIMKEDAAFKPYVQPNPNRPNQNQAGMVNNPDWGAFYLWKDGEIVTENAVRCPHTMRALADVPFARVPGRSPSVLFSLLRPGAHIPPHNGFVNTRLICHLPLIVPDGCRFRVGNEVRQWVEGKAWLFDDTIEHEAWNDSKDVRVILLFEIWRPELTTEERSLVSAMFESIDAHRGKKTEWGI